MKKTKYHTLNSSKIQLTNPRYKKCRCRRMYTRPLIFLDWYKCRYVSYQQGNGLKLVCLVQPTAISEIMR